MRAAAGGGALALAFWGAAAAAAGPSNPSSHGPEFFRDLLAGRVWVGAATMGPDAGVVRGVSFGADGGARRCERGGAFAQGSWGLARDVRHRALLRGLLETGGRLPEGESAAVPVFYDAVTGRLHAETWVSDAGAEGWLPVAVGHVQESWPGVLAVRCPELAEAGTVAVNERQTEMSYEALAAQDESAPMRAHRGSELRGPGARGRGWMRLESAAMAGAGGFVVGELLAVHAPSLPAEELKRFLAESDGEVLVHDDGSRHVLVLRDAGDELWRLARDDSLEHVGHLTLSGDEIVLQYENSNREERWDVDFALPLLPTGERYAAMHFGDWLTSRPEPVVLPFHGIERVGFHFASDGTAAATTVDGGEVGAEWQWSRGSLVVRVRGFGRAASYPWERLAAHVGWPGAPAR